MQFEKKTFCELGTLLHCFNERSFITAQNVLLWPACRHVGADTCSPLVNCAINCTLLKAVPNV